MEKDLLKFFNSVRENPNFAIEMISSDPDLVKSIWKGDEKMIPGSTALHWAAHDGHTELVKKLIELGADINSDNADWWCRPIDWAVDSASYDAASILIENGADLGGDKWSNCTPLHVVAQGGSSNGKENRELYIKTAELLIDSGAEVNAAAKYGGQPPVMTPLDDALNSGNEAVAEVLIKNGGKQFSEL